MYRRTQTIENSLRNNFFFLVQIRVVVARRGLRAPPGRAEREVDCRASADGRRIHFQSKEQRQTDPTLPARAEYKEEKTSNSQEEKYW